MVSLGDFTVWQILFLSLAIGTSAGFVLGLLRWVCREVYPHIRKAWQRSELLSAVFQAIQSWRDHAMEDDMDIVVHLRSMERKIRHFRAITRLCSLWALSWNYVYVTRTLTQQELPDFAKGQAVALLLAHIVLAVAVSFPELITHRTLDIFYGALVLGAAAVMSPWSVSVSGPELGQILGSNGVMVLLNGARRTIPGRRLPVFGICNMIFYVASAMSIYEHGDRLTNHKARVAFYQLMLGAGGCVGLAVLESSSRSLMKQNMQLQEVKELMEASCTLLRSCCQVVVETDAFGVITSEETDLSSFLLRGGGQISLKGTALADLLVEEDRERFLARLQEMKLHQTGLAENLPVSMRDGCGNVLRLSLLWLQFNRSEGQRCMMGIRELGEPFEHTSAAAASGAVCSALAPGMEALSGHPLPLQRRTSSSPPVSRASSLPLALPEDALVCGVEEASDSAASAGGAPRKPTPSDFNDEGALLLVDCSQPGCPVRLASSGFGVSAGPVPPDALLSSFMESAESFQAWLQDALNVITYELRAPGDCWVQLKFGRRRLKASCKIITFTTGRNTTQQPVSTTHVGLFFFDFKRVRARPRTKVQTRRGSSARALDEEAILKTVQL